MDQKMKTKTPLKTNTRWQRDPEDKKTFSDNRFRPQNNNGGRFRGRNGRGRGGRGRGGRGRGGYRNRDRSNFRGRDVPRKPANFVLPEGNRLETDFPILGKPKVKNANILNWRIAAEKGAAAPPPPIFVKKKPTQANSVNQEINLDDYDEEEYDSAFCDDDDNFPTKGGYMD